MKKIKIATISMLVLLEIVNMFREILPGWVMAVVISILLAMFIILNIEAFKIKGLIKKLTLWVDVSLGLWVLFRVLSEYFLLPSFMISGYSGYYLSGTLILMFEALIIAVLINAYKEQ